MRNLTDCEMALVAGGTSTDIVVRGHRDDSGSFIFNTLQISAPENRAAYDGGASTALTTGVYVNVHVADPNNLAGAEAAAEKWSSALSKIIDAASHVPANTPVPLPDGSTTTAGDLLNYISQTKFTMTDTNYQTTNGGVGGADHLTMTDNLDFRAFGDDGYGSPNYSNQQGMVGIALHEVIHLSDNGYQNLQQERSYYFQETHQPPGGLQYFGSAYGFDDERFADLGAESAAAAINIDVTQFANARDVRNGGYFDYQGGANIYFDHNT